MTEIRINYDLLRRARKAREKLVNDDSYKTWEYNPDKEEKDHLDKIGELCEMFDRTDFAAIVTVAVKNYPEIVLKAVLDELTEGDQNDG